MRRTLLIAAAILFFSLAAFTQPVTMIANSNVVNSGDTVSLCVNDTLRIVATAGSPAWIARIFYESNPTPLGQGYPTATKSYGMVSQFNNGWYRCVSYSGNLGNPTLVAADSFYVSVRSVAMVVEVPTDTFCPGDDVVIPVTCPTCDTISWWHLTSMQVTWFGDTVVRDEISSPELNGPWYVKGTDDGCSIGVSFQLNKGPMISFANPGPFVYDGYNGYCCGNGIQQGASYVNGGYSLSDPIFHYQWQVLDNNGNWVNGTSGPPYYASGTNSPLVVWSAGGLTPPNFYCGSSAFMGEHVTRLYVTIDNHCPYISYAIPIKGVMPVGPLSAIIGPDSLTQHLTVCTGDTINLLGYIQPMGQGYTDTANYLPLTQKWWIDAETGDTLKLTNDSTIGGYFFNYAGWGYRGSGIYDDTFSVTSSVPDTMHISFNIKQGNYINGLCAAYNPTSPMTITFQECLALVPCDTIHDTIVTPPILVYDTLMLTDTIWYPDSIFIPYAVPYPEYIYVDTGTVCDSVVFIDSVSITYTDSLVIRDSTVIVVYDSIHVIDSIVVNYYDSLTLRDSTVVIFHDSTVTVYHDSTLVTYYDSTIIHWVDSCMYRDTCVDKPPVVIVDTVTHYIVLYYDNGDTIRDTLLWGCNVGLYPNPTFDWVWVYPPYPLGGNDPYELRVFALTGQQVWYQTVSGIYKLNMTDLAAGEYLILEVYQDKKTLCREIKLE